MDAPGDTDVVVVGGGIGGLSSAFALARSGHSVRVLEKAAAFGEVGAGIQLAPNATRILRDWGLLDDVMRSGVLPRRLVLRDAIDDRQLIHADLTDDFQERYGAPYVVVHRSDLHRILLEACRRIGVILETSRDVGNVAEAREGIDVHCLDGTVYGSEVTIAADGLTSRLRSLLVQDEPVAAGLVAYRGTVSMDDVPPGVELDDVTGWIGPDCDFVQYGLRGGTMLNSVASFVSPGYARGDADWGGPDELEAAFAGCSEHVRRSLQYLWRDRRWNLYDRNPIEHWVKGRLVLTGDAAHPMLQYLAQGACQAMEDAEALAWAAPKASGVGGTDWDSALAAYEAARTHRTARLQRSARVWCDIWHLGGAGALLRNEFFSSLPDTYRYTDWLYAEGSVAAAVG
jgi:2-polyprenyl-6-methoxyphenol hydroxylase-like FAD-dependent oxidoreductase